jgi:oligoribonuclease NrnB/cAMP/cGMP phosphodiesterase (DHH superfamily)
MEELLIIYHDKDFDGIASGAILKEKYPHAKLQGYDHGRPIDFDIPKNVIIVDIALPMDIMFELSKTSKITWIDHHISSYNKYIKLAEEHGEFCDVVFDVKNAACVNTWKYLYPDKDVPYAIQLIADYDIYNNSDKDHWNNEVLPFQYAMRTICNTIDEFPINIIYGSSLIGKLIEKGTIILEYQRSTNEYISTRNAFESKFKGLNALCLNNLGGGSMTVDSVYDETKHDIIVLFGFNGKKWHVFISTTKEHIDCSVIATSMGGGGHKMAAGFDVDDISTLFK